MMVNKMVIAPLRASKRLNETILLFAFSLLCLLLSLFRLSLTDTRTFLFLNYNLFLAFIPWGLSSLLQLYPAFQKKKIMVLGLLMSWLLFFPNAPYILTDLFHLKYTDSMPQWFDLLLILSFAWVGLLFGMMSLWDIEKILESYLSKRVIPLVSTLLLFIGSFGIYLGRFLRWNSWDILHQPSAILWDVTDRFMDPMAHPRTWGVTLFMGLFLNLVYWSMRLIKSRNH